MSDVTIDTFKSIQLVTAKILEVEEIAGADRIWKLLIEIGPEKRVIVAGVKQFYSRETLIGKSIVVVSNLQPATIKGVESKGMLLAAKGDGHFSILTLDKDVPSGLLVG